MLYSTLSLAVVASLAACTAPEQTPPSSADTQRMVERLRQIALNRNPISNIYLNDLRVEHFSRLQERLSPLARLRTRIVLAREHLRAGQTQASIDELYALQPEIEHHRIRTQPSLDALLGLAYMRLGEQVNCLEGHTTAACLFPIGPDGVHADPQGSRTALGYFTTVLEQNPDDLTARWLLNIAYMTLGEYPDQVPSQWLLAPSLFASEYDIGHFPDIAPFLRLDLVSLSGGSIMDDFDNDGLLDLVISSWALDDQLRYFRNQGDGTFSERTQAVGLTGLTGGLQLVHADFDNDSYLDFLVLRGAWMGIDGQHPNSLVRNQGGTFADVTEAAGLLSFHPTQTAAWADMDNDGWLDLFVGNETFLDDGDIHPSELFHNQGDGTFAEKAASLGLATKGFVKGATWGDFDNDGQVDLYVSRLLGDNFLFRNRGARIDRRAALRRCSQPSRGQAAAQQFSHLVLGLRQRRLARLIRFGLSLQSRNQRRGCSSRLSGPAYRRRTGPALSQPRQRHFCRCQPSLPPPQSALYDGVQLRRSRQRRLARFLRWYRCAFPALGDAQPHVSQRRRTRLSGRHRLGRVSAICRKGTG